MTKNQSCLQYLRQAPTLSLVCLEYRGDIFFHKEDMLSCLEKYIDRYGISCNFLLSCCILQYHYKMNIVYPEEQSFLHLRIRSIFDQTNYGIPDWISMVLLLNLFLLIVRKKPVKLIQHTKSVDMCLLRTLASL